MKIKSCKICGGKRLYNSTLCYKCTLKKEKAKQKLKLLKFKKRKKKKREKEHNSYRYLNKLAWKLFSEYIRKKDATKKGIVQCYTCNRQLHWKEMNAGHFWHNTLDFDERNIHSQCRMCNTYKSGNLAVYGMKLLKELGENGMEQLDKDAHTKRYNWLELKQIIEKYKEFPYAL